MMSVELFDELERKVVSLVQALNELRLENGRLQQDNERLYRERGEFKARIDSILERLEGV